MEPSLAQPVSSTVFSTTMEYTAFAIEPSTLPKTYKLTTTSSFTPVTDYNRGSEFDKAKVLFGIEGGEKTLTVVVSNM